MKTEKQLRKTTKEFFENYWSHNNGAPPEWSNHWYFNDSIPNNEKRGCYALFKESEIIYIGVGIGKGTGIYQGCGLGFRLKKYWEVNKDKTVNKKYRPTENWKELTSIITIGFEENHYSSAAALEVYLINKINPSKNFQHK